MDFFCNKFFLIAMTFVTFVGAQYVQRRTGLRLLNPILLSIAVMVVFLTFMDIDYDTYSRGGEYIDFWLKPAVVALGVPLYRQLEAIKKQMVPLLVAEMAGCVAGVVSVVLVAEMLGASKEIVSLARVKSPIAAGLSMGTAAHAVGTSAAIERSDRYGAFSSLGLTLNGLLTSALAPFILRLMGYSF